MQKIILKTNFGNKRRCEEENNGNRITLMFDYVLISAGQKQKTQVQKSKHQSSLVHMCHLLDTRIVSIVVEKISIVLGLDIPFVKINLLNINVSILRN